MDKVIEIHFSFFAPKISEQLKNQGFLFNEQNVKEFEDAADSILDLNLMGILNDTEKDKAIKKLYTMIKAHVKVKNKLKEKK